MKQRPVYVVRHLVAGCFRVLALAVIFSVPASAECWRQFLRSDTYIDLDSVSEIHGELFYCSKQYQPDNRHSSEKTGFFYQRHTIDKAGSGRFVERPQPYDWYHNRYLPWQVVNSLSVDQYLQFRVLLMDVFHKEGRTDWARKFTSRD